MPGYSYDSGRLTLAGTIGATQTWSINIGFTAAAPNSSDLATWLPTLNTAVSTWWNTVNGVGANNAPACVARTLRAEFYPAGTTNPSAAAVYNLSSPLVGSGSTIMPTQTSIVHSLLTGRPGKSYRGRLYVPLTAAVLDTAANLGSTRVDAMCTSMSTLLHAINISTLAASAPTVVVRGAVATPQPVTVVRVDSEPDIQRRRADKLAATYTKTATV